MYKTDGYPDRRFELRIGELEQSVFTLFTVLWSCHGLLWKGLSKLVNKKLVVAEFLDLLCFGNRDYAWNSMPPISAEGLLTSRCAGLGGLRRQSI